VFHLITEDHTEELSRKLHERHIDLLIGRRPSSVADERLSFEFLFDDSYFVVAGRLHPWAGRRRIEPAELVQESWVLPPPESQPGIHAMEAFRAIGLDYPRTAVFAVAPDVRMSLLATGRYLTIFSNSALRFPTRRPELKVLPVGLPLAPVPVGINTLKNRTLSPTSRLFIDTAREVAKPLAKGKS
jgi:DNA-binding transcriptional LysR family regulator